MVEIKKVESKKDLKRFILLPWKIYEGDKNWVPPLISQMKEMLDRKRHPFHRHADVEYFLAYKNGELVGRIAAIVNHNHNKYWNERTGFFGFFESIDDEEISSALFRRAEEWLRERGMERMRGPMNFSTNEECGLLIKGFEYPPVVMMTYNPKYYIKLYEAYGMKPVRILYAYRMHKSTGIPERLARVAEYRKRKIDIRKINRKKLKEEIKKIKIIYNDAWGKNWGFVPLTDEEIDHIAKNLKQIADWDLIYIAEINGEPAGFSIALPDINIILKYANGRLFPFGLIKMLLHQKEIKRIRVFTLGVREKFRFRGLDSLFIYQTIIDGIKKGYEEAEMSWILDINYQMNKIIEDIGGQRYKEYAIYEKSF